jgi:hypothetical protein
MAMFSSARSLLGQPKVHASGAARPFGIAFLVLPEWREARKSAFAVSPLAKKKEFFDRTVPNCHVTEIDFSQRLESKQASKKQHIQMVNRIILIFSSHPDRRIHADWIKHSEAASEPSRSLPRAGIRSRPTTFETRSVSAGKDEFPLWSGKFLPDTLCGCILTTHNGSCARVGSRD